MCNTIRGVTIYIGIGYNRELKTMIFDIMLILHMWIIQHAIKFFQNSFSLSKHVFWVWFIKKEINEWWFWPI